MTCHEVFYGGCSVLVVSVYDVAIRWDVASRAGYTRIDPDFELSARTMVVWVLCAALLAEAHFFWTHRCLHAMPWLYRNVHMVHHASHDVNPLSGISFHPIESAVYFSSVLCGVLLLPMSVRLYHAWRVALFLSPIGGHIGIGDSRSALLWPLHMIAHYHYVHHTQKDCNYGGFILWDWICGTTYQDMLRHKQAMRSSSAPVCPVGEGAPPLYPTLSPLPPSPAIRLITASCIGVASSLLVASEPLCVLLFASAGLYLWLLSGFLVIAPPRTTTAPNRPKVFCIGLSRTGTTSITVALHHLGFAAHHQCHALVRHDAASGAPCVNRLWAEVFDAHADIAPATVFEELARIYPDAKFVLTRREPRAWAHAMIRFTGKFRYLLRFPPIKRMFDDVYGAVWSAYDADDWARVYAAHERRVLETFAHEPHRLLKLDITAGAGWTELCPFVHEALACRRQGRHFLTRTSSPFLPGPRWSGSCALCALALVRAFSPACFWYWPSAPLWRTTGSANARAASPISKASHRRCWARRAVGSQGA